MAATSIEWTKNPDGTPGKVWNPVRGCTRVSAGCEHCYAEKTALRFSGPGKPYEGLVRQVGGEARWTNEIKLVPEKLAEPLTWRKPSRVFVNSMSDLFHEKVPDDFIGAVFGVMACCPEHTFQVLTKRPDRMLDWFRRTAHSSFTPAGMLAWSLSNQRVDYPRALDVPNAWPLPNVWLGVSVEDQRAADERIPLLLQTPAAVRFLSVEPLLASVDLRAAGAIRSYPGCSPDLRDVDWVIVGGESGLKARPMHPDWVRSIRDQCQTAGVPFFFKQWGQWSPDSCHFGAGGEKHEIVYMGNEPMPCTMVAIGKKAAGRLLDGREWSQFPELRRDMGIERRG